MVGDIFRYWVAQVLQKVCWEPHPFFVFRRSVNYLVCVVESFRVFYHFLVIHHERGDCWLQFVNGPQDVLDANVVLKNLETFVEQHLSAAEAVDRVLISTALTIPFLIFKTPVVEFVELELERRQQI